MSHRTGRRPQTFWWLVRLDDRFPIVLHVYDRDAATDPNARMIRPGMQGVVPHTADEMASYFKSSTYGQLNRSSIDSYHKLYVNKPDLKAVYDRSATSEHARHALNSQPYILSIPMQVRAVMRRRLEILKGDWVTQAVQAGFVIHHIDSIICWRLICNG